MRPRLVTLLSLAILTGLPITPRAARAHATLTYPPPRTLSNKLGPCGADGSTRGDNVSVFRPGETITVTWDETVDHVGHYRLAFDEAGDDDFPLPQTPQDAFPSILVDQIPDRAGGGPYSQEVTLPNLECESCTLQLIQIMTTQVPYNSFYFQCADIALRGATVQPDAGATTLSGESGCAISHRARPARTYLFLTLLAALLWRRRRAAAPPSEHPSHAQN